MGVALVITGAWWLLGPGRLLVLPGAALVVVGAALVWLGGQRAQFRNDGQGPGTVEVDEGQIRYFGPLTGGAVALQDLTALSLDRAQFPAHWRLSQPGQPDLMIPTNADGAEALFDAFATLPGLQTARMLQELQREGGHAVVIWRRGSAGVTRLPVH